MAFFFPRCFIVVIALSTNTNARRLKIATSKGCGLFGCFFGYKSGSPTSEESESIDSLDFSERRMAGVKPLPFKPTGSKTVAIFADFDGCFDLFSIAPTLKKRNEALGRYARQFDSFMNEILKDAGRVILFTGSTRQSYHFDQKLTRDGRHASESSFDFFELLAGEQNWELNKATLADHGVYRGQIRQDPEGRWVGVDDEIQFAKQTAPGSGKHGQGWKKIEFQQPAFNDRSDLSQKEIKLLIAKNNFEQLKNLGDVEAYFFDDKKDYIDHVRQHFAKHVEELPRNVNFFTVHFSYYDAYETMEGKRVRAIATYLKKERR